MKQCETPACRNYRERSATTAAPRPASVLNSSRITRSMEALLADDDQLSLNARQKHSAFQQLQVASGLSPFRVAGTSSFRSPSRRHELTIRAACAE